MEVCAWPDSPGRSFPQTSARSRPGRKEARAPASWVSNQGCAPPSKSWSIPPAWEAEPRTRRSLCVLTGMGTPTWPVERSPRCLSEKLRRSERWRAELLRRRVRGQVDPQGVLRYSTVIVVHGQEAVPAFVMDPNGMPISTWPRASQRLSVPHWVTVGLQSLPNRGCTWGALLL